MNRTTRRRMKVKEMVLAACVVLMTAWLTMTVAGWLTGGLAEAIVR